jgi:tripartite-type tricarboxylate transporter receptor subunit TctC
MAKVPALLLRGFHAALVSAPALLPTPGRAQSEFPSRPIKLVVPFPAGGGIDTTARVVAQALGGVLGQQILVQNQGGAGGAIATDAVSRTDTRCSIIRPPASCMPPSPRSCPTSGCGISRLSRS